MIASLINLRATFALQDIEAFVPMDTDWDAEVSAAEPNAAKPAIAYLIARQSRIQLDGQDDVPAESGRIRHDNRYNAPIEWVYSAVPHQQHLSIKNADGKAICEKMSSKQDN